MLAVLSLCVAALLLSPCQGYSLGAGDEACGSMVPGHKSTSASKDPSPFEVVVSKNTYNPGDTLQGNTGICQFEYLLYIVKGTPVMYFSCSTHYIIWVPPYANQIKCAISLGKSNKAICTF